MFPSGGSGQTRIAYLLGTSTPSKMIVYGYGYGIPNTEGIVDNPILVRVGHNSSAE
jgi:hypothetical protein